MVMSGYNDIIRMQRLIEEVDSLGLMMTHSRYGNGPFGDFVGLKPKDETSLPIYTRDAELFCGTLEELNVWLRGVKWARDYDRMLKVSDDKKRERKEQDERNRILVNILRDKQETRKI
jgi:hypothetical protein